jgi:DNA-binding response OmpR family regulator
MVKILCIEDETDIRELLVEELKDSGFTVLEANNGREGYKKILSEKPDIVLCDITMPEMDGRQLFADLQINHPELSHMEFIFLTALADKDQVVEGLRSGANAYLTKPIDFEVLMANLSGCIMRLDSRRVATLQPADAWEGYAS